MVQENFFEGLGNENDPYKDVVRELSLTGMITAEEENNLLKFRKENSFDDFA